MATTSTPSVTSTTPARGVIYIHSAPRALCPHLEWAVGRALGRAVNFDWADQPVLAVRLQEVFGLTETPRLADGRVPVLLHLLSPARRPAAVTADLASFWVQGYPQVRADLRGRYPKHAWPDDPLSTPPSRGPKRPPR